MTHTTMERRWAFDLQSEYGHREVTSDVESLVVESGIRTGIAVVQMVGSTGGVTTIEYESGALTDLRRAQDGYLNSRGGWTARAGDLAADRRAQLRQSK